MRQKISQQANIIGMALKPWVTVRGGLIRLAPTQQKMWQDVLDMADENPRCIICFTGEQSRGGFASANKLHRVDRQWVVAVVRGKGFTALLEDSKGLAEKLSDQEAFYDQLETIRDLLRVILNISEEFPVDYKGIETIPGIAAMPGANTFMDGGIIRFSTANDIQDVVREAPPQ